MGRGCEGSRSGDGIGNCAARCGKSLAAQVAVPPSLLALVLALVCVSCATVAPPQPRFVVLYSQRNPSCQVEVIQDTRSRACFVAVLCGRRDVSFVPVPPEVCVP